MSREIVPYAGEPKNLLESLAGYTVSSTTMRKALEAVAYGHVSQVVQDGKVKGVLLYLPYWTAESFLDETRWQLPKRG